MGEIGRLTFSPPAVCVFVCVCVYLSIYLFILQKTWITQITAAISCFTKNQEIKNMSLFTSPVESSEI